jgi:CHAD domain-containing protein
MKLRAKRSARENASRVLPRLAKRFLQTGFAAVEEDLRGEELHDFRIQAKRFRYVLEFLQPCYGQAMDTYLEAVRGLQTALGDLNDCCSTRTLLEELLGPGDPPTRHKKLFGALDRLEQDRLEKYRVYWNQSLGTPDYRERFLRYLAHPPRVRPGKNGREAAADAA